MKYRTVYTKSKKNAVKKRLANGESIASLAKEFDIPYGTIGRWQWNMRGGKHIEKAKEYEIKHRLLNGESSPSLSSEYKIPYGTIGRWKSEALKNQRDRDTKREKLIAYLIGVVVGMAVGSLVMRAIYG